MVEEESVVEEEQVVVDELTRAVNFGKILEEAEKSLTEAKNDAAQKSDNAKTAAQQKVALEQTKVEPLRKKYGNYLASWTRMDLFPSMTRENIYPRTAMERTQRRDFLGKGMGKVYPFGLKNKHQMSGAGGNSSDLIKLRRLYGRAKYWKKRDWEF